MISKIKVDNNIIGKNIDNIIDKNKCTIAQVVIYQWYFHKYSHFKTISKNKIKYDKI